jgi:Tfp pilus assembly protein PilF
LALSDQAMSRIIARQTIEEMTPCIEHAPANITPYMIRAAALRMLGRPAEAGMDYRRALRIDRRAELYFNLGLTELEAGREEQAADALTTAVLLFYPYIDEIPQPMQERVRLAVTPVLTMIQRHQATPEAMAQLRARMTREPL